MLDIAHQPTGDQQSHESVHTGVLGEQDPVEPSRLIVSTVAVVVAELGTSYFVAHHNHRDTQREHSDGHEVFYLPVSQLLYRWIVAGPFNTAVPASIVVRPVPVTFAIGLIVFLVIRDQVVESEAVMTRHEIEALFRLALLVTIKLRTTEQSVSKV